MIHVSAVPALKEAMRAMMSHHTPRTEARDITVDNSAQSFDWLIDEMRVIPSIDSIIASVIQWLNDAIVR